MKIISVCIASLLITLSYGCFAGEKIDKRVERRLNKASCCHLGLNCNVEANYMMSAGLGATFRYGANRQLMNYMGGIIFGQNTTMRYQTPAIAFGQFSIEGGIIENLIRTSVCSVYLAESLSYNVPYKSKYIVQDKTLRDKHITNNNFSTKLIAGLAFNNINCSVYVKYDINPIYNQRYIYESPEFDYYGLEKQINNRLSYGITILYYINF